VDTSIIYKYNTVLFEITKHDPREIELNKLNRSTLCAHNIIWSKPKPRSLKRHVYSYREKNRTLASFTDFDLLLKKTAVPMIFVRATGDMLFSITV